jgi:hypothetical protein
MRMAQSEDHGTAESHGSGAALGLVALAFAVTLAVIVGNRLSDEALAVLAGAVCGVGAAIPTSLLILAIARRRDKPAMDWDGARQPHLYPQQQGAYPPVIVVAPPNTQQQPFNWNGGYPSSLAPPTQRQFTVVGGTPTNKEARSDERYF